ncbi:cystathionine beta-synthase-like isoform X2 [Armigeres subalbatus]
MIEEAEERGLLKPGYTILEPTSGNTGIGLAMGAAVKGYKCIVVMPDKMSIEKVDTLKALGAEVIRTPTEAGFELPGGVMPVTQQLQRERPNIVILNQFINPGNPLSHYDGTASEIIEQLDGKVDMIVTGAGTGGTVTGLGRKLKEHNRNCKVICSDPIGSVMAIPASLNETDCKYWEVEGVGYEFIPTACDVEVIDEWIKYGDKDAFETARKLIVEEGLLCGGSAGGNMYAALQAAKSLGEGQNVVVILPDNIRNHLTKFVSDNWMEARNFSDSVNIHNHKWWDHQVSTIIMDTPITIKVDLSIQEAVRIMKKHNLDQLPVLNHDGSIRGAVYLTHLLGKMLNGMVTVSDPVLSALYKQYVKIGKSCSIGRAARILEKDPFVLVTDLGLDNYHVVLTEKVIGMLTQKDILQYVANA